MLVVEVLSMDTLQLARRNAKDEQRKNIYIYIYLNVTHNECPYTVLNKRKVSHEYLFVYLFSETY